MLFRYRPARPSDLTQCLAQARDAFAYTSSDRADLKAMWTDLLSTGSAHCPIIEDCTPKGYGVAFFAFFVFISPPFLETFLNGMPPMTSGYLLQLWRDGDLPLLTEAEIRRANATEGVNMLCLTSGISRKIIADGKIALLGSKITEYHPYALGGFHLRSIFLEVYDDFTYDWSESFGYNRLTDYADYYRNHPLPAPGRRPRLYGIFAPEACLKVGGAVSMIFQYQPPCFGFTPTEQEFLLWALSGETDEELAANLNLAVVTVKKRWGNIYTRVANVMPQLFGADTGLRRGSEKKRPLLTYLRHHMEELRPYQPFSP